MSPPELTEALDGLGVVLSARLVVDAPTGVLTPELRDSLARHKALLLQRVIRELVWAELSTWRWGDVAPDAAIADPTPGLEVDTPDPARRRAALEAIQGEPGDVTGEVHPRHLE